MQRGAIILIVAAGAVSAGIAAGDEITLFALKDNTLYEDAAGALSNGAGDFFFVGRTQQGKGIDKRRGVLAFNLASVPAGSTITSVELQLECSMSNFGNPPNNVGLHRALVDWGEGASDATGAEGQGAPSEPGDATWIHRFFNTTLWTNQGGDYAVTASATTIVTGTGPYSWGSTSATIADVQHWIDNPSQNFGWVLVGNETDAGSAKRFQSRTNPLSGQRPHLVVNFDAPAAIIGVTHAFGTFFSGNINSLRLADNDYYRMRSQFGFLANEPNINELWVRFIANTGGPTMQVVFEGWLDQPNGQARLRLRNYSNGSFDQIDAFPITQTEVTRVLETSTTNRIRFNDQQIELSVKVFTPAVFSPFGFTISHDLTRITILP